MYRFSFYFFLIYQPVQSSLLWRHFAPLTFSDTSILINIDFSSTSIIASGSSSSQSIRESIGERNRQRREGGGEDWWRDHLCCSSGPVESPLGDEWSSILLHGLLTIPANYSLSSALVATCYPSSSHTAPSFSLNIQVYMQSHATLFVSVVS